MKMQDYMKKKKKMAARIDWQAVGSAILAILFENKRAISKVFGIIFLAMVLSVIFINRNIDECNMPNLDSVKLSGGPIAAASSQRSVITIPTGMVKANPFVPYRDITETGVVNDVPAYSLVEPPEAVNENSDAARVMDTIVSGILFDKFSPSAIINIEGSDYLVKKGDVVNNYKVINIAQDSVTVQLGTNSYKAGIGEILTEGTLNHNEVSNLNNKFGGER